MKRYHVNLEVVARDSNVPTHTQDLFSLIIEEEGEVEGVEVDTTGNKVSSFQLKNKDSLSIR